MTAKIVASNTGVVFIAGATTTTVNLPAGILAGDLLLACWGGGLASGTFAISGWTNLYSGSSRVNLAYKVATGSEGSTATATWGSGTSGSLVTLLVRGASVKAATFIVAGTTATATSANPITPTLSPSWGSADTLWIGHIATNQALPETPVTWPSLYPDNHLQDTYGSGPGVIAVGSVNTVASSISTGTFTIANSAFWAAQTVGILSAPRPSSLSVMQAINRSNTY